MWIPCFNSTWPHNSTVLGFDGLSGKIDANISMPIWAFVLSSDPENSEIYADGWNLSGGSDDFSEFNSSTSAPVARDVPSLEASEGRWGGTAPFAYDTVTGEIVFGAANDAVMELDPATGASSVVANLTSEPIALAIDPATNQIFVSTSNLSSVEVLNAANYAVESQIGIPNCFNNICADPNDVNQVLVDPSHGDAYLISTIAILTLNLSDLSVVGTIVGYGDGPQITATYLPSSDRIFGTYQGLGEDGPGLLVQLDHGFLLLLTSFLWLPPSAGVLVCAAAVGAICGLVQFRGPPVSRRIRRKPGPGAIPPVGLALRIVASSPHSVDQVCVSRSGCNQSCTHFTRL